MALIIYPDFLKEYVCRRKSCRRTCCRDDWDIVLTKQEFFAAGVKTSGDEHSFQAAKYFQRNPHSTGDDNYACCRMRSDGFCTLLTTDGLCSWQNEYGESVGAACNYFPMTYISFLGDIYEYPTASCEAVVEHLLKRTEPIVLESRAITTGTSRYQIDIKQRHFLRRPLLRYYPDLVKWGTAILQDRRFSLDDRFTLLAGAMTLIDRLERINSLNELPEAMSKFFYNDAPQKTIREYARHAIGADAIQAVTANAFITKIHSPVHGDFARFVLRNLGISFEETDENNRLQSRVKHFDMGRLQKRMSELAGFIKEREIFLEHIMVCEYLRSMVPVTEPDILGSLSFFNACYALLKGVIYGAAAADSSNTVIADVVVLLYRMFIHQSR